MNSGEPTQDTSGFSHGTALVASAVALAPQIRASAVEIETGRRLPAPLVESMVEAGLFRMLLPESLGGNEADPATALRTFEEVARADGATGWCLMIGATSGLLSAYLREDVAREIYSAPGTITGGVLAPTGTAAVVAGGYRVRGRWAFGSGIEHCRWRIANCVVTEDGAPRLGPAGIPELRIALVPAFESEVLDTWHVSGLRGTGSHDFTVSDRFVPGERTISLADGPVHPGSLYRFPLFGLLALAVAACITGMARGAIDSLVELASTKVPIGSRRVLRDRVHAQMQVAQAEALLRSARAFIYDAVDEVWSAVRSGATVSLEQRAVLRLAACHAATAGAQAVDLMYNAGGATSIYDGSPLQRFFRDVHAATQHTMVSPSWLETAGRLFLGLESETTLL